MIGAYAVLKRGSRDRPRGKLVPSVKAMSDAIAAKADLWREIVKIGRTHMQDATPLTLGEEWSVTLSPIDF